VLEEVRLNCLDKSTYTKQLTIKGLALTLGFGVTLKETL
jgi:hypothetical protein